jgi:hypothetical protein
MRVYIAKGCEGKFAVNIAGLALLKHLSGEMSAERCQNHLGE